MPVADLSRTDFPSRTTHRFISGDVEDVARPIRICISLPIRARRVLPSPRQDDPIPKAVSKRFACHYETMQCRRCRSPETRSSLTLLATLPTPQPYPLIPPSWVPYSIGNSRLYSLHCRPAWRSTNILKLVSRISRTYFRRLLSFNVISNFYFFFIFHWTWKNEVW